MQESSVVAPWIDSRRLGPTVRYRSGAVLFVEGERPRHVCMLLSAPHKPRRSREQTLCM